MSRREIIPYLSYQTLVSAPSIRVLFSAAPSHAQMISPKGDAKGREIGGGFLSTFVLFRARVLCPNPFFSRYLQTVNLRSESMREIQFSSTAYGPHSLSLQ